MSTQPNQDPEFQHELARLALAGLDRLLSAMPPETTIAAAEVGAIVRLIVVAGEA